MSHKAWVGWIFHPVLTEENSLLVYSLNTAVLSCFYQKFPIPVASKKIISWCNGYVVTKHVQKGQLHRQQQNGDILWTHEKRNVLWKEIRYKEVFDGISKTKDTMLTN